MASSLRQWPSRRWLVALGAAAVFAVAASVPTDVIPNPLAHREVPATWWSYPVLGVTALLAGMLAATYVRALKAGLAAEQSRPLPTPVRSAGRDGDV